MGALFFVKKEQRPKAFIPFVNFISRQWSLQQYYTAQNCASQAICTKMYYNINMEEKSTLNYGEAFKEQREKLGLSQSAVAKRINTSHQNISRWESGKILPNIDFCVKLADLYGISLDELIGRDK